MNYLHGLLALVIIGLLAWIRVLLLRHGVMSQEAAESRRRFLLQAEEQRRLSDHVHWLCTVGGVSVQRPDQAADPPEARVFTVMVNAGRCWGLDLQRLAEVVRDKFAEALDEMETQQHGRRSIYTAADHAVAPRNRKVEL
jgi:hypothetical protein